MTSKDPIQPDFFCIYEHQLAVVFVPESPQVMVSQPSQAVNKEKEE